MFVSSQAARPSDDPYSFEPNPSTIDKLLLSSTNAALQAGLLEAIEFVQEIGIDRIEQRNLDLAGLLKEALAETPGVRLISPLNRDSSTGLVSFAIEGASAPEAVSQLWRQHRIVARPVNFPAGIRVSMHFFNTEEEVHQVVDAVRNLA
jgi:cysteine desulfurase/selenocysteine lyase